MEEMPEWWVFQDTGCSIGMDRSRQYLIDAMYESMIHINYVFLQVYVYVCTHVHVYVCAYLF